MPGCGNVKAGIRSPCDRQGCPHRTIAFGRLSRLLPRYQLCPGQALVLHLHVSSAFSTSENNSLRSHGFVPCLFHVGAYICRHASECSSSDSVTYALLSLAPVTAVVDARVIAPTLPMIFSFHLCFGYTDEEHIDIATSRIRLTSPQWQHVRTKSPATSMRVGQSGQPNLH